MSNIDSQTDVIQTGSNVYGAYRNGRFSYETYGVTAKNPYESSEALNADFHADKWAQGFNDARDGRPFRYAIRNNGKTKTSSNRIPLTTIKRDDSGWSARPSEVKVVDYLKSRGIYATLGRGTMFRYVDVVAWGCIPIEVKHANEGADGLFKFRVASRHHHGGIQGNVLVLICTYRSEKEEIYFLPIDMPELYLDNGELKSHVIWGPNKKSLKGNTLTADKMAKYLDAYQIVEERRIATISKMVNGEFSF